MAATTAHAQRLDEVLHFQLELGDRQPRQDLDMWRLDLIGNGRGLCADRGAERENCG